MFKITDEQISRMGNSKRKELIEKMILVLRSKFEEATQIPDEEFEYTMHLQIERALHYGLTLEMNIAVYTVTAFLLGENFDSEFKAVDHFLPDMTLNETRKAEALQQWSGLLFSTLEEPVEEEEEGNRE
jgi:sorbitol-specific phosphotransferase system component IIA